MLIALPAPFQAISLRIMYIMLNNASVDSSWDPQFMCRSPMFEPLQSFTQSLAVFRNGWPSLDDYQTLLAERPEPILTQSGMPLKIAAQGRRPQCLEEQYASRIYLTGEIQTRAANWHDFFNC